MISRIFLIVFASIGLLGCTSAAAPAAPPATTTAANDPAAQRQQMLQHLADAIILPAHATFEERTAALRAALNMLHADPTPQNLTAAQDAWRMAYLAWQPMSYTQTDRVRRTLLHNGINKTPPNTDFIEAFIAGSDPLDAALIAGTGSTSKGLPALEYLLFTPPDDPAATLALLTSEPRRLDYAHATAEDLHASATALHAYWLPSGSDYRATFITNDGGGATMRSSVSELANAMVNTTEVLVQTRLGEPLGRKAGGTPQPELVEAAASNATVPALIASVTAFRDLFTGGDGLGFDDYLNAQTTEAAQADLAGRIVQQADTTIAALQAIPLPLEEAVIEQPATVEAAYEASRELLVLLKVEMANALGVTLTFGDTDGD